MTDLEWHNEYWNFTLHDDSLTEEMQAVKLHKLLDAKDPDSDERKKLCCAKDLLALSIAEFKSIYPSCPIRPFVFKKHYFNRLMRNDEFKTGTGNELRHNEKEKSDVDQGIPQIKPNETELPAV